MSDEVKLIVESLGSPEVLVTGDFIADVYIWGVSLGASAEAPTPLLEEESREVRPAGAALVAENLAALGAKVRVLGIVGGDEIGEKLLSRLSSIGVDTEALLVVPGRITATRTRYLASLDVSRRAVQQVLSVVVRNPHLPQASIMDELRGRLEDQLAEVKLVVCCDYGLCRPTRAMVPEVVKLAKSRRTSVVLDPKGMSDLSLFSGATVLVLNRSQAEAVSGIKVTIEEDMRVAGERIAERLSAKTVVITVGRDGVFVYRGRSDCRLFRTEPVQVSDLMGAEEAVLSALSAVLASGGSYEDAALLANAAAGVAIREFGAPRVGKDELLGQAMRGESGKVLTRQKFVEVAEECHRSGKKVVFTNGCFDILHVGHLKCLRHAKGEGDVLMVAVNSDDSVRKLKGSGRPIMPEEQRTELLAAFEFVDYVTLFGEETPIELIKAVRPDVLVKGGEWAEDGVVGREFVESYEGKVVLVPVVEGFSSTRVIERMRGDKGEG